MLITSTSGFAKQYYKWVDGNGTTHYTTTPPPKNAKNKGKIDTYGVTRNTSTTPTPENDTRPNNNSETSPDTDTQVTMPSSPSAISAAPQ